MIDVNKIVNEIVLKLKANGVNENIAYENSNYTPNGSNFIYLNIVTNKTKLLDTCRQICYFSVELDYHVEKNKGIALLRNKIKQMGNILNPLYIANSFWQIDDNILTIINTEESNGGTTPNGYFYNTLIINCKVVR